jgi:hypothetical protein
MKLHTRGVDASRVRSVRTYVSHSDLSALSTGAALSAATSGALR